MPRRQLPTEPPAGYTEIAHEQASAENLYWETGGEQTPHGYMLFCHEPSRRYWKLPDEILEAQRLEDERREEADRLARQAAKDARTARTRAAAARASALADSSDFILTTAINVDPDAAALSAELANRGWPGDSCSALRNLERRYAAALELLVDAERRAKFPPSCA